jgi:hypothetical protein
MPLKYALMASGFSEKLYKKLMERAYKDEEEGKVTPYTQLKRLIEQAQAEQISKYLKTIDEEAIEHGNWKAAAWVLEHRYSDVFGKTTHQEVKHQGEIGVKRIAVFQDIEEAQPSPVTYSEVIEEDDNDE